MDPWIHGSAAASAATVIMYLLRNYRGSAEDTVHTVAAEAAEAAAAVAAAPAADPWIHGSIFFYYETYFFTD